MNPRRYVICDIEATGLEANPELIEIALITWQEGKIIDVYQTLINPLRPVSEFIQQLTHISGRELLEAPKFYEVAEAIKLRLEGAVFVSHKTDFDYVLLKSKFEEMGEELNLKTFCTLKVAQKLIPGLRTYTLDGLCNFFGIHIQDRHRAIGDARATLELFQELQNLICNKRPRINYLPHHQKLVERLPAKAGLLSFLNESGRAFHSIATINMRATAQSKLKVKPENKSLLEQTEDVLSEETGSTLIAEFKKMTKKPLKIHWMIAVERTRQGEKSF